MKILYLVYYYFPRVSAATWSTYALTERLANRNDVFLVVPNIKYNVALDNEIVKDVERKNPSKLYRTPSFKIPLKIASIVSPFFLFLKGLALAKDCDVVVCQFQPHHFVFLAGLFIGKIFRLPVVARANDIYREMGEDQQSLLRKLNVFRKKFYNALNESFIKIADVFFVVCIENKEILESRLGKLKNLSISYNGVNPKKFQEIKMDDARKYLDIKPQEKVILFLGRFSGPEYKIVELLKAFSIVKKIIPDCLLILVGDKITPAMRREIPYDSGSIRVVGPSTRFEIKNYISAADVCIGPLGRTRAIPLKVLEYMASGKPVISGIESISRELAVNGLNCICVKPEPKDIAEAIINVLQDEGYKKKLVLNAKKIVNDFTWDEIAGDMEEILFEVTRRSNSNQ